jgi:hypothetical protein
MKYERFGVIRVDECRRRNQPSLDFEETLHLLDRPDPRMILLQKIIQWSGNLGEVGNEFPIVSC